MRSALAATLVLAVAAAAFGCGEEDESATPTVPPTTTSAPPDAEEPAEPGLRGGAALSPREREVEAVERTAQRYIAALDAGDGSALCDLLAPGATDGVELPRDRASCAESFDASIGYRDPRGLPVFGGASLSGFVGAEIDGREARATATVITEFTDRDEPSVEDDVIYLTRRDDEWLIAKASSVLYRAVGIADVPPQVLTPPR